MKILTFLVSALLFLVIVCAINELKHCLTKENPHNEIFMLDENFWELILQDEWIIVFCLPVFNNCIKFERLWSKFAKELKRKQSNIIVASMKLENSKSLIKRFSIHELPTIIHVKNGVFRKLPVAYTVEDLRELVLTKYKDVEPMPFWQHPNGIIMCAYIRYIKAINMVYNTGWLGMTYEQANWIVRIGLMLIAAMFLTAISAIYAYQRDKSVKKIKKIGQK